MARGRESQAQCWLGIACDQIQTRLATDASNGRQANHGYQSIIEDPMLELHQFHAAPKKFGDLALELYAAKLHMSAGRCAYVSRQGLVCTFIETERVVEEEFSDAARAKPRESAIISQFPEGKAPITIETMPPEKCRLRRSPSHGLNGISHKFANMPKFIPHTVTIRHSAASGLTARITPRASGAK